MNRFDATREVLILEAAAGQLRERAKEVRLQLDADARAELTEHGSAPTWRLADLGTWSLPVSKEAVYVSDDAALLAWVKSEPARLADVVETVERVRPWYVAELLRKARVVDGYAIDDDGTVIPGLAVRPGGAPQTLRFKPSSDALAVVDQAAARVAGHVVAELLPNMAAGGAE